MYGPPGTGKTLLARACAAQTDATFLKLAGPQLVQMFIGDGAKLVRDCFALAKEKAPAIIFIDELDAVGTKRFDSEKSGDREVQRTMLELLNQLDGFASDDRIKVLAATNRVDVLDPALLRSGRLDRKIEFPLPNEEARAQILKIHSRKMTVDDAVNWPELSRSTDEFGGAMLKAVCVEAGMIALRTGKNKISHEHYVDAISEGTFPLSRWCDVLLIECASPIEKKGNALTLLLIGLILGLKRCCMVCEALFVIIDRPSIISVLPSITFYFVILWGEEGGNVAVML